MKHHDESTAQITPFSFDGHQVRAMNVDGEPVIVGKDACEALGIKNHRDAINRLDPDGVGNADVIDSLGRTQSMKVLREPAVYELVFQSRVQAATDFKRWVTREVLPTIRKAGSYNTAPGFDPASLTRRDILTMALEAEERADALEVENQALKGGDGIRIKDFIKTYFVAPNERAFFEWFYYHGLLIDGRLYDDDGRASRSGSGPKLRWDHAHPTYLGRKYFKLVPSGKAPTGNRRAQVIPERALDLVILLANAEDLPTEMTKAGRDSLDEYQRPGQLHLVTTQKRLPA